MKLGVTVESLDGKGHLCDSQRGHFRRPNPDSLLASENAKAKDKMNPMVQSRESGEIIMCFTRLRARVGE